MFMDMINARASMYEIEKKTIKAWLNQIGFTEPVGYWFNYGARNLVLYTDRPGQLIGKHGQNIEVLRNILMEQMVGDWTFEIVEIKGGFVV